MRSSWKTIAQRMVPPERLLRDRDVFAPVRRGARRTGEELHAARRSDVLLAGQHLLDVGLERLVIERLDHRLELLDRADMPQVVTPAEFGPPSAAQQLPEDAFLRLGRPAPETVDGPLALRKPCFE